MEGGLHVSEMFSLLPSLFLTPSSMYVQEQIDQLRDELRRTKLDSRQDRFHLDSLELEAQLLRSQKKEMDRLVHTTFHFLGLAQILQCTLYVCLCGRLCMCVLACVSGADG